jgi:hypothetical protein
MYATYRREYENFTHLPGESIDALFQRFTMVVNNMRANVDVLQYDDHDRAIKLLHSLDRTIWVRKFEAIVESEKYDTLMVNELFSKLKSVVLTQNLHLAPSTQQAEQAGFTREEVTRRASQFSLKIDKRQSS